MNQLKADWLTEGLIDFEYKKYILLSYLQDVSKNFDEKKLYPVLNDMVFHYNNLILIRKNKMFVSNSFPKQISKLDFENFKVHFEQMMLDEEYMEEVEAVIDFALPQLHVHLKEGKEIYQEVEEAIKIFPVGILSLNPESGFIMLSNNGSKEMRAYDYEITIFENANENFRGIKTNFIGNYTRSISNTLEAIKFQLMKEFGSTNNPSTFAIESQHDYPLNETLLPVAKRSLVRFIYSSKAA